MSYFPAGGGGVPTVATPNVVYANDNTGVPTPVTYSNAGGNNTLVQWSSSNTLISNGLSAAISLTNGTFLAQMSSITADPKIRVFDTIAGAQRIAALRAVGIQLPAYATIDLPSPVTFPGSMVYDSTTQNIKYSNGTAWTALL